jgi:hypothetical protein
MSNSLFFPLGFEDLVGVRGGGGGGGMQFTSFSSSFGSAPTSGLTKRTSTSTRFINGKKITTKK